MLATPLAKMDGRKPSVEIQKRPSFDVSGEGAWLNAHHDPVASLYTFSSCIDLEDLDGDGDYKLVVGDLGDGHSNMKLKIYKGTQLNNETALLDLPTTVKAFMMDTREPAIAVAAGSNVFIYKTVRPYFKFTLPLLEINSEEKQLWTQLKDEEIDPTQLRDGLESLNNARCDPSLTVRSLTFLQLEAEDFLPFTTVFKQIPLKKQSVVTCMSTLHKSHSDPSAPSCIVVGTENRDLYILDAAAFTFLLRMTLPAVPVFLSIAGIYDVDYSISIACRNGCVYTIKKDFSPDMPSFPCVSLSSQAVGLIRDEENMYVGTMDRMLSCYNSKGKMLWSVSLPDDITAMERMNYKMRDFKAVIIALANNEVRIYKDKYLVNTFKMEDVIVAMKFGQYGREDGSLILINRSGALTVKILKRNVVFEAKETRTGPLQSQVPKLNIPKKTKAFVDQAIRERENATFMHQTFQHHLLQLKVETAKSYAKAVSSSLAPVTSSSDTCLAISAQVQGIGPMFKITVILQNTSPSKSLINHYLIFQTNDSLYSISKRYIKLPMLVPGLSYTFSTMIECLDDFGRTDTVKVYVHCHGNPVPLLTAVIDMPASENIVM